MTYNLSGGLSYLQFNPAVKQIANIFSRLCLIDHIIILSLSNKSRCIAESASLLIRVLEVSGSMTSYKDQTRIQKPNNFVQYFLLIAS